MGEVSRRGFAPFAPYALVALTVVLLAQLTPTNDAGWQLWIGRQLISGAELYREIVEINPPLWFWLAAPIVALSDAVGISTHTGLMLFFGVSAAISIALVQRLKPDPWLWITLVVVFFAIGISATGQREQFTLIAVTPYLFLAAARAEDRPVPLWLAISVGALASVGFALKHYFVLAPLALELWLLWRRRWGLRPELLVLAAAAMIYGAAILVFTPDYLRSVVPLIRQAYGGYDQSLPVLLFSEVVLIGLLALLGIALARRARPDVQALIVAGMAFLVCYFLQRKGFRYHGLPAIGMFFIAAISVLKEQGRLNLRKPATIILLEIPVIAFATTLNHWSYPSPSTSRTLCELPPGASALVLSAYGNDAWPAIETCDLRWASRYMFLWMLPAITRDPIGKVELAQATHEAIAEDIARYRPRLVMIDRTPNPFGVDAYTFVMTSGAVRAQLKSYQRYPAISSFAVFRRRPAQISPAAGAD